MSKVWDYATWWRQPRMEIGTSRGAGRALHFGRGRKRPGPFVGSIQLARRCLMAKVPKGRGFVLHLPVLGVADRKTLWHKGLPASLRTAALPRTKQPILLLF